MTPLLLPLRPPPAAASASGTGDSGASGTWDYWRAAGSGIIELGTVQGLDVALPVHFHDEDQVTFVLSGRRRFVIGGEPCDVAAGQGLHIPAATPHHSLSGSSAVICLNLYLAPAAYASGELITALAGHWRRHGGIGWAGLTAILRDHPGAAAEFSHPAGGLQGDEVRSTVRQAAQRAGMSREGFSRQFSRRHGLPPHAFWLLQRLNDARRLLRAGEPIAAIAADTGFADQSHLGRCFRRAFGITPGRYRAG